MATITADKLINHDLYAKANTVGYDYTFNNIIRTFVKGQRIGNIYSYVTGNDGQIYYLIYLTKSDYDNQYPTYIKHEPSVLDVPDLPDILQKIEEEKKAAAIAKDGVFGYYLQTYLPYIVGAIVVAVALPSIVKSFKK